MSGPSTPTVPTPDASNASPAPNAAAGDPADEAYWRRWVRIYDALSWAAFVAASFVAFAFLFDKIPLGVAAALVIVSFLAWVAFRVGRGIAQGQGELHAHGTMFVRRR